MGPLTPPKIPIKLLLIGGGLSTMLVVVLIGILVVPRIVGHYYWPVESLYRTAPEQPIPFPHTVHAEVPPMGDGIDCVFCHRTVATERMASIPAVEQCYFCHKIIGQETTERVALPGIQALNTIAGFDPSLGSFDDLQPIDWMRVHRLPDHVRFVHEAHITFFSTEDQVPASVTCVICHGDVAKMEVVNQERSLKMGDCVNCHKTYGAPTDCATCHY